MKRLALLLSLLLVGCNQTSGDVMSRPELHARAYISKMAQHQRIDIERSMHAAIPAFERAYHAGQLERKSHASDDKARYDADRIYRMNVIDVGTNDDRRDSVIFASEIRETFLDGYAGK